MLNYIRINHARIKFRDHVVTVMYERVNATTTTRCSLRPWVIQNARFVFASIYRENPKKKKQLVYPGQLIYNILQGGDQLVPICRVFPVYASKNKASVLFHASEAIAL